MKIFNYDFKSLSKIFLISSVPITSWSAPRPNIFLPKFKTFFFLCLGLILFGLGESILVISQNGVTPWTVLAEGVAKKINIGIGLSTFIISCIVLIFWLPLKLKPGLGTIMNIIIIAVTMGGTIPFLYFLNHFFNPIFLSFFGTLLVGFGSGIYLIANLGPGTRDGLMTGISKNYNKPISLIRFSIEFLVVFLGWLLGGTLGIGTIIFAVFIGPFVSLSLKLVAFLKK
tara:strand:- start:306 stop:989 length:684 start_codon:yes stop_codon:yes gene_type:complete